jgi:hypothetical protein
LRPLENTLATVFGLMWGAHVRSWAGIDIERRAISSHDDRVIPLRSASRLPIA